MTAAQIPTQSRTALLREAEGRAVLSPLGPVQFTDSFDAVLASTAVQALRIPPRSPAANTYAGRFVPTARTQVTGRMLISGERHLRLVLAQHAAHCNGRRRHRSRLRAPPAAHGARR